MSPVVAGVEIPVESDRKGVHLRRPSIKVRMLGPLRLERNGLALALPASRKVRALLAYLALAPLSSSRSHLCELLWDAPSDPRGELRWCLSKIRGLLGEEGGQRVATSGDTVRLDVGDCFVDAIAIARAAEEGIAALTPERQRSLAMLFEGEFLDGLEIERSPVFSGWLTAQRRRFRACHAALLEHLAKDAAGDGVFEYLNKWRELAPFDQRVHETLLGALARRGRFREGEEHVEAAIKLFEAEGLNSAPLRNAWRSAKTARTKTVTTVPFEGREEATTAAPSRRSLAVMPFIDCSTEALDRRRPRRKGSLTGDVKVAHTPEQSEAADCQRYQANRRDKPRVRACDQPTDRNSKGNDTRQSEKRQQRPYEHEHLTPQLSRAARRRTRSAALRSGVGCSC
jgi:DNA-binding SARP family transcriptional activator